VGAGVKLALAAGLGWMLVPALAGCGGHNPSGTGLPANLLRNPGRQVAAFTSTSGWTVSGGAATLDTSHYIEGGSSLELTTSLQGGKVVAERAISQDMSGSGVIRFWVYFNTDWRTTVNSVNLCFSPVPDFSRSFSYYLSNLTGMHEGWNLISLAKGDFKTAGDVSWSERMVRLRIELVADKGQLARVCFDDLRSGVQAVPTVVMSFDDGDQSVYSTAYPIMAAHGLTGTAYVVSSRVGQAGKMTLDELRELYAAGWDIGNHTATHPDLAKLDVGSVEDELNKCATYLMANGMPRGALHVAYPDGSYNDTVLQAMTESGMLTGRTVDYRPEALPLGEPYMIPAQGANAAGLTLADVEAEIDRAVREQASIFLFFHAIGPYGNSYTQSTRTFTSLCDYIKRLGIRSLTISQFYALNRP
jgi:peptidoglycan/xylan/chitin deacetylase (PgdA/CDA1 family)